jgi:hypothetical protein
MLQAPRLPCGTPKPEHKNIGCLLCRSLPFSPLAVVQNVTAILEALLAQVLTQTLRAPITSLTDWHKPHQHMPGS